MSGQEIPNGTEFAFSHAPEERWRVEEYLGDREDDEGAYTVYRCRIVGGDTGQHEADRNPDGTVDLVGEAIADALEVAA